MGRSRGELAQASGAAAPPSSTFRAPDDDFFCLRFGVWYNSWDCAYRTRFRTCGGCRDCEQGRFNLRRHEAVLPQAGLRLLAAD